MVKKKKGTRIGNPVVRAAAEAAERKRTAEAQERANHRELMKMVEEWPGDNSANELLNDETLNESEILQEKFMQAYPHWSCEDNPEQPWEITSQIIRAFDGYVMWRNEMEENGEELDLERCFKANKVTDVSADVRKFLEERGLIHFD